MKNLIFLMMAILLINVSYAGELGEDLKGECIDGPQHSRAQRVIAEDSDAGKKASAEETAIKK